MSQGLKLLILPLVIVIGCGYTTRGTKLEYELPLSTRLVRLIDGGPAAPGKQAPDVVLLNLDGRNVHLNQFFGKQPTILLFSSINCPYSVQEYTEIQNALAQLGQPSPGLQRVKTFTIIVNETPTSAYEYLKNHQAPGTVLLDSQSQAAHAYGIKLLPTVLLIDSNGYVNYLGHFTPAVKMVNTVVRLEKYGNRWCG